jgi:hypothetical protein
LSPLFCSNDAHHRKRPVVGIVAIGQSSPSQMFVADRQASRFPEIIRPTSTIA